MNELLDSLLKKNDLIILISADVDTSVVESLCKSKSILQTDRNIVVISSEDYSNMCPKQKFLIISESNMNDLLQLYRTYEFSDKVIILDNSTNYGLLFNYVDNGLLSYEEAFEVLLT